VTKTIFKLVMSTVYPGNTKSGKYHCTVDLQFDWLGISCITTDNVCFDLQDRLIPTGKTGGQLYSNTSPLSVPWFISPSASGGIQTFNYLGLYYKTF
jgi:hypothetical protein